ncbi:MAG: hypothetical protein JWQ88_1603 [Rhodoferax sp.]|nr:hypothetical protein [Rhodoferax sp.]
MPPVEPVVPLEPVDPVEPVDPIVPEPVPVPVAPVVPVPPAVPALLPAGGATAPDGVPGAPVVLAAPPSPFFFWQAVRPMPATRRIASAGFHVLLLFIKVSKKGLQMGCPSGICASLNKGDQGFVLVRAASRRRTRCRPLARSVPSRSFRR